MIVFNVLKDAANVWKIQKTVLNVLKVIIWINRLAINAQMFAKAVRSILLIASNVKVSG